MSRVNFDAKKLIWQINWHIKPTSSLANYQATLRRSLRFDLVHLQVRLRKDVRLLFPVASASNRRKRLNHCANYLRFQFVIKVCTGTANAAVISKHFGERDKRALNQRYHRSSRSFSSKTSRNVHQHAKNRNNFWIVSIKWFIFGMRVSNIYKRLRVKFLVKWCL